MRLREVNEVGNKIVKQFVPETCDCRRKTLRSDYFTYQETLTAYITNFVKYFQSTHSKEAAISQMLRGCHHWKLLEKKFRTRGK